MAGPEHVELVQKALTYAEKHTKVKSDNQGEPYIIHPIQVAGKYFWLNLHMHPSYRA